MNLLLILAIIVALILIIVLFSRSRIYSIYKRYLKIPVSCGLTGKEIAFLSKDKLELSFLQFGLIDGVLTDGYNTKTKMLLMSEQVMNTCSISSAAIIGHEIGHVLQHKENNGNLALNRFLTKTTNFTNKFILPLVIIGLFLYFTKINVNIGTTLTYISFVLFFLNFLCKLLLIPLEFNASKKAVIYLKEYGIINNNEYRKVKKVLRAAGQTYITSFFDGFIIFNFLKKKSKKKRNKK